MEKRLFPKEELESVGSSPIRSNKIRLPGWYKGSTHYRFDSYLDFGKDEGVRFFFESYLFPQNLTRDHIPSCYEQDERVNGYMGVRVSLVALYRSVADRDAAVSKTVLVGAMWVRIPPLLVYFL